jgi:hypothetical protein
MAQVDACAQLVVVARRLAVAAPQPRRFLVALGRDAAGIRPGPAGLLDLARGGTDLLRGRGFKRRFDDATSGQVRHFAGVAVSAALIGGWATRHANERLRGDPRRSADGLLTEAAIEFADLLVSGRLPVAEAPDFLDRTLCARSPGH